MFALLAFRWWWNGARGDGHSTEQQRDCTEHDHAYYGNETFKRITYWRRWIPYPSVAVPQGVAGRAAGEWNCHPVDRPQQGHLQDRGLCSCGQVVGSAQESSGDELRQAVPLHQAVLQEGHHEEDGAIAEVGLPVLSSLQPVVVLTRWIIYSLGLFIASCKGCHPLLTRDPDPPCCPPDYARLAAEA